MYLQITTKCNMSCEHCYFRCTMNGKHMPRKVWRQAIEFLKNHESHVSIGGGEPTLHPQFWEILGVCIGNFESVWLATNGSQTETAMALASLAKKGAIGCALSQDYWHDPIDQRVVDAFTSNKASYERGEDQREIRNVLSHGDTNRLSPFRDPKEGGSEDNCPCEGLFISPSGKIRACGCFNAPIVGDVFNGLAVDGINEDGDDVFSTDVCWRVNMDFFASKGLTSPGEEVE